MKTTRLQVCSRCPYCAYELDAATAAPTNSKAVPRPGDCTVCIECGGVLIFSAELTVRRPAPDELAECLAMPEIAHLIRVIHQHRSAKP